MLLCRRAIEPRLGKWGFPQGFMELGESARGGAARESQEEAGAFVVVGPLLSVYNLPGQVQLLYLATMECDWNPCDAPDGGPTLELGPESSEARFFAFDDLPDESELAFPTVKWALDFARDVGIPAWDDRVGFAPQRERRCSSGRGRTRSRSRRRTRSWDGARRRTRSPSEKIAPASLASRTRDPRVARRSPVVCSPALGVEGIERVIRDAALVLTKRFCSRSLLSFYSIISVLYRQSATVHAAFPVVPSLVLVLVRRPRLVAPLRFLLQRSRGRRPPDPAPRVDVSPPRRSSPDPPSVRPPG